MTDKPQCYITMTQLKYGKIHVLGVNSDGIHMFDFTTKRLDLPQVHNTALQYVPTGYVPVFKMPQ